MEFGKRTPYRSPYRTLEGAKIGNLIFLDPFEEPIRLGPFAIEEGAVLGLLGAWLFVYHGNMKVSES